MRTLTLIALALALALAGCQTVPNVPEKVLVAVEQDKKAPDWAKAKPAKPVRAGTSVEDHLTHEDALDGFTDYLACRFDLLVLLMQGETVDPATCKAKP